MLNVTSTPAWKRSETIEARDRLLKWNLSAYKSHKGANIKYPGGGGAGVFVADKLFISTRRGGALKISNLSHVCKESFSK